MPLPPQRGNLGRCKMEHLKYKGQFVVNLLSLLIWKNRRILEPK